jgi:hypothetical protein
MSKVTIEKVDNGYIVEHDTGFEEDSVTKIVCQEKEEDFNSEESGEVDAFADLLWTLNEMIGPSTSRYAKKRIYIEIKPGDKYEDTILAPCQGQPCEDCDCEEEDDLPKSTTELREGVKKIYAGEEDDQQQND